MSSLLNINIERNRRREREDVLYRQRGEFLGKMTEMPAVGWGGGGGGEGSINRQYSIFAMAATVAACRERRPVA